ncbi:MAG: cyclic nucleotide-binding domain-containing protein [Alphaproteobacteria bacterium]|nr:cyclic nucleotide-binding domain-containing protein [Alphaproteobacteria bacterium]
MAVSSAVSVQPKPSPARLGRTIEVGVVSGLWVTLNTIALAALIFPGPLADRVNIGIGLALFSSAVFAALVPFISSYAGMVAGVAAPVAIVGLMGAVIMERSPHEVVVPTLLVALAIASLLTGAFFLVLGYFRWGRIARYIPFPVVGGFLGAVGWLVVLGAFSTMTGLPLTPANLPLYFEPWTILKWAPGLTFGLILTYLHRRHFNLYNLPAVVVVGITAFWMAVELAGAEVGVLRAQGWLFGGFGDEGLGLPFGYLKALPLVDWKALLALVPLTASLMTVSLINTLITSNAIELSIRKDINLNRELRAIGTATLLSGLGGGLTGAPYMGPSRLTQRFGVGTRAVGIVAALVCVAGFLVGGDLARYLPTSVAGVLLIFVGTDQLLNFLVAAYDKMTRSEYAVVLIVFAAVVFVGFIEGIVIGVVAGVILFAVNYSRVSIVYSEMTGVEQRSNVDRSEALRQVLRDQGVRLQLFELQGFLFFGTAYRLVYRLRDRINDRSKPPLRYVVLDFRRVNGLDSSAAVSFTKLCQYAQMFGFDLCFAHLPDDYFELIRREGIAEERRIGPPVLRGGADRRAGRPDTASPYGARLRRFADIDHALEWCENDLLFGENRLRSEVDDPLQAQLARQFPDMVDVAKFMTYVQAVRYGAGEELIRQSDESRDLYFIESGEVTVEIRVDGGEILRLRVMGAGTCVGEVAFYLGRRRSASVVTTAPTTAYRLTGAALDDMQASDPAVAAAFHEFMARQLAKRLSDTDRLLEVYAH